MKTIQIINKLVARELGAKEALVESVNDFYWKEVRKKLSSLETTSIYIKHLGTVTTSKRKIDQFIRVTIKKIRTIRKSTKHKPSTVELILEINYNRLKKALIQRNILAKQYYEAYTSRSKRIHKVDSDNDLSGGQDTRGDIQPSEDGV